MNHYEPGISYPRRRDDWVRDHPLASRLLIMLVGFAVLVPIGLVFRASQGNVVRSGGLPGAALAADPLIVASSTTTTTALAVTSTVAPAVSSVVSEPAATPSSGEEPSTAAVAPEAAVAAVAAAEVSPSTTVRKATTTTTAARVTTAAKKAAATTAAPKATTPPTTKAAPTTTATTKAPTTTTAEAAPAQNTYSKDDVEAIIRSVFPAEQADEAVRVATRESNLVPTVRNWCCYGLFQIYFKANQKTLATIGVTSPAQLYDPAVNAQAAYLLFQRSGWAPWR